MCTQHPTDEEIRARAYQIYLERGGVPGYAVDDWLQAEYELRQVPTIAIAPFSPREFTKGKARNPLR